VQARVAKAEGMFAGVGLTPKFNNEFFGRKSGIRLGRRIVRRTRNIGNVTRARR
jgi:hypothetical protein